MIARSETSKMNYKQLSRNFYKPHFKLFLKSVHIELRKFTVTISGNYITLRIATLVSV